MQRNGPVRLRVYYGLFIGKIKNDIKKQQDRLEERIKERKLRSENGSVKKSKADSRGK